MIQNKLECSSRTKEKNTLWPKKTVLLEMRLLKIPLRRLEGITYWVIENPDDIYDYINTELCKEWEEDAKNEHRNPNEDSWLKSLAKRSWILEVVEIARIKLNPDTMNYVDLQRGYDFAKSLAARSKELQDSMRLGVSVIWPLIVKKRRHDAC